MGPGAPGFMDVMKQHPAFVKQMPEQGNMAIAGPFPFTAPETSAASPSSESASSRLPNWRKTIPPSRPVC